MSLHGEDELVLPKDAYGQVVGQSSFQKRSIAVQAKQLALLPLPVGDQDMAAADDRVKTVDNLLNIKLSATVYSNKTCNLAFADDLLTEGSARAIKAPHGRA